MAQRKVPYTKRATTHEEQIQRLCNRGVIIEDVNKVKEYLADIGYYRLGFYLYPFENTYPCLDRQRSHEVKPDTRIEDVVALYYFDFDLRNILNKYLSRIEVAIRTTLIYELSNKYVDKPTWFVNPKVVTETFINEFSRKVYDFIQKKPPIERHHKKYRGKYAPAWKTMEYMTFGNLEMLYDNLIWDKDKRSISLHFGEPAIQTFKSYLTAVREVRNACAHGNVLFSMTLTSGIRTGSACATFSGKENQTFKGALRVIDFLLKRISENRAKDMWQELYGAVGKLYEKTPSVRELIESQTGITCSDNII